MARSQPPYCKQVYPWLRYDPKEKSVHDPHDWRAHGKYKLGALTGQDAAALEAFVHAVEVYTRGDTNGRRCAIEAMRALVLAMQPKCWIFAREAIAMVYDWSFREKLWAEMGFPEPDALEVMDL